MLAQVATADKPNHAVISSDLRLTQSGPFGSGSAGNQRNNTVVIPDNEALFAPRQIRDPAKCAASTIYIAPSAHFAGSRITDATLTVSGMTNVSFKTNPYRVVRNT